MRGAKADKGVVATACLYRSARIVAERRGCSAEPTTPTEFGALAERTRAAFIKHYVADDGTDRSATA